MTCIILPSETIDLQLAEMSGLVEALLMIAESDDQAERERMRNSTVTLLYVTTDKIRVASKAVGRCPCRRLPDEAENAA